MKGGSGLARSYATKDRPSGVKPACVKRLKRPSRCMPVPWWLSQTVAIEDGWDLSVEVVPPKPDDEVKPEEVKQKVVISGGTQEDISEALKDGPATVAKIALETGQSTRLA